MHKQRRSIEKWKLWKSDKITRYCLNLNIDPISVNLRDRKDDVIWCCQSKDYKRLKRRKGFLALLQRSDLACRMPYAVKRHVWQLFSIRSPDPLAWQQVQGDRGDHKSFSSYSLGRCYRLVMTPAVRNREDIQIETPYNLALTALGTGLWSQLDIARASLSGWFVMTLAPFTFTETSRETRYQ